MAQRAFSDFIGFSRLSSAWRFNSSGVLVQDAANTARDDYDPISGLWNGLLIEEARTNLLLRSQDFSAVWSQTNVSLTANAATAPDGTATATKLIESAVSGTHQLLQTYAFSSILPASLSFYVKAAERTKCRVFANWDLSISIDLAAGTSSNPAVVSVKPVGGGWFRCAFSAAAVPDTASRSYGVRVLDNTGADTYTGDGTSGIFVWGAQLEAGTFPTSYIPTTSAQVTRAVDMAFIGNLSPWFNPNEGTLYLQVLVPPNQPTTKSLVEFGDGTLSNRFYIGALGLTSGVTVASAVSGVTNPQAQDTWRGSAAGSIANLAVAYSTAGLTLSVNGATPVTAALPVVPTVTRLALGSTSTLVNQPNGHIRALKYTPRRMTNPELQAMTALPNANGPTLAFNFKNSTFSLEHM